MESNNINATAAHQSIPLHGHCPTCGRCRCCGQPQPYQFWPSWQYIPNVPGSPYTYSTTTGPAK